MGCGGILLVWRGDPEGRGGIAQLFIADWMNWFPGWFPKSDQRLRLDTEERAGVCVREAVGRWPLWVCLALFWFFPGPIDCSAGVRKTKCVVGSAFRLTECRWYMRQKLRLVFGMNPRLSKKSLWAMKAYLLAVLVTMLELNGS